MAKLPLKELMQVLQEVAAARHILIKSGSTEIDGYAFCRGLSVLEPFGTRPDLQALIPPMAYLIKGAVFRGRHDRDDTSRPARFSLNIRPLGELVDMYHTRKATDPLDKVYALLGMSSDDPGIEVNYESSWKDLFWKLVDFSLSNAVSISTWDPKEVAVIETKSYVLGEVSSAGEDVEITWKTVPGHSDVKAERSSRFALQASAKVIKKGDIVCLLEGASRRTTIIRACDGFSTIIRIAGPPTDRLPIWSNSITTSPTNLLLVWDWDESERNSQGGEGYEYFLSSREVPKCPKTECRCHDHLDKAVRLWNFGILLNTVRRYEEAVKNLRKAVEVYGNAAELRSRDSPDHGPWREGDKRVLGMMDDLVINDKGVVGAKDKSDLAPLWRAAENGYEAVLQLLLAVGKASVDAEAGDGQTPLSWAWNGREAVVQLLLATGNSDVDAKDSNGRTPLSWAAEKGYATIAELLLSTGKADIDAKSRGGQTPLSWAASNGQVAVVQLLATGKADINTQDRYGRTPLLLAAKNGHEAVVEQLLATGKANVNTEGDAWGRTPLSWAAENGHEAIMERLLAMAKTDVDAK